MSRMLRQLSAVLIATVLLLSLIPMSALAAQSGDYYYEVSNGKATITGYTGSGGALTIPAKLGGYPVTAIGRFVFSNLHNLTSVTIPTSVTSIGVSAFEMSDSLTSVTIPASVNSIGDFAFRYCYGLTALQVNASNATYASQDGVLFNKAKTKLIQYPIGNSQASYTIPGSVTGIASQAFCLARALTSVTISTRVASIGDGAFDRCINLTSITIPASVASIGAKAFGGCYRMTDFQVSTSSAKFASQDGVLFDKAKTKLIQYPIGNARTSYTVPGSVTGMEAEAFAGCGSLASVTIPASVAIIGEFAFGACDRLAAINVSASNAKYASQDGALFDTAKTKLIQYPTGNTRTSYTIPGSVTGIGTKAFAESISLTKVVIPSGVTTMEKAAFAGCAGLKSITIPNGLTKIEEGMFAGCSGLSTITIPGSITRIGGYAFLSCTGLTSVTISGSVTAVDIWAFFSCTKLERAYFLGNAPAMGEAVFGGCKSNFAVVYVKGKTGFTNPWHSYPTAAYAAPVAPKSVKATSAGYNSMKITWAAVSGASGYEVYRATSSSGVYGKVATITGGSSVACADTGLTTGKVYYYKVKAYRQMGSAKLYSVYSTAASAKPVPGTPTGVKATRVSASSIKVEWAAVDGATKYEIRRATSSTGNYTALTEVASTNFTDTGRTAGKTYFYKVRAYRLVGTKVYGMYSAIVSMKP